MVVETIDLKEFAQGEIQKKFHKALEETVRNILDPSAEWKTKRTIQIELTFTPDESRKNSIVDIKVKKKLAPILPSKTMIHTEQDLATGKIYMEECKDQCKGQMKIEDYGPEQEIDGTVVDTDTGEII